MKNYKQIHYWEHKRRIALLEHFRNIIAKYYEKAYEFGEVVKEKYEAGDINPQVSEVSGYAGNRGRIEAGVLRKEINKRIPEVTKIVENSDLPVVIPTEFTHQRRGINVFENLFKLDSFQIPYYDIIDLIDKSIGMYETDRRNAFLRTLSPFYWFNQSILSVTHLPFGLLEMFGFEGNRLEKSGFGDSIKGAIKLSVFIVLSVLVLHLFQVLDDVILIDNVRNFL